MCLEATRILYTHLTRCWLVRCGSTTLFGREVSLPRTHGLVDHTLTVAAKPRWCSCLATVLDITGTSAGLLMLAQHAVSSLPISAHVFPAHGEVRLSSAAFVCILFYCRVHMGPRTSAFAANPIFTHRSLVRASK